MATKLADAYVQIIPVAKGIKKNIGAELQGLPGLGDEIGKDTGSSFAAGIKGVIAKAGIAAAIGTVVKEAFSEGAQLEQSLGGVETLFKEHADIVKKNAQDAYKTAGLSANEYMQNVTSFSASLLSSLGGDTKKAAEIADMAMIDMSDNANKFGSDMAGIQNAYQGFAKQNYTMLDNLKLGYGGTKEEMQRLLRDAEKFSGVKYDIKNLDDVYKAIHIVQENLDITGTTAKEASQTFSGSFDSMKAAAKNFLGALTTGGDADKAFKNLEKAAGVFFDNIKRMGKAFIDGAVKVFDTAVTDALGKIGIEGEAAQTVLNGIKIALEGAAIAFISFKAAAVMSKVITAMESFSIQTAIAKLQVKAMNAEMLISKGLAVGIAAAVGMIGAAVINNMADAIDVTKDYDWEVQDLTEDTKKFGEECRTIVGNVNKLHDAVEENRKESENSSSNYQVLSRRLKELNDVSKRSTAEQAEMEAIVSQLNEEIPGINLSLDEQSGSLKNNADLVGEMAYAYTKMQQGQEMQENLAEATRNAEEAEKAFKEAVDRRNEAIAAGFDRNGTEMQELSLAVTSTHAAFETATADLEEVKKEIEDATYATEAFNSGFGDMNQYILNLSDSTLEEIDGICQKYAEAYQAQHDLVFGQMDLLDEFVGKSEVTKEDLQKNLDENIEGFTGWENDLAKLRYKVAQGIISQDFYDNLEEMGPKGAGYAKAFVDMSDKELREYSVKSKGIFDEMNDYVDRSMSELKEESAKALDKLIDLPGDYDDDIEVAYKVLGTYAMDGYAEGIRNGSDNVNDAIRQVIQRSINTTKSENGIASPSKVFRKFGNYVTEGYALGIADEADLAQRASAEMVRSAIVSANKANDRIAVSAIRQQAIAAQPISVSGGTGMKNAFLEALAEYGAVAGSKAPRQPVTIPIQIGSRVLGKAVISDINEYIKLNGSSPIKA